VVTFAGNNNLDYGVEAFEDTLSLCAEKGISVVGGGGNLKEAMRPVVTERNGLRIAFVNFCSILRPGYAAKGNRAGISPLRVSTFYEPLEDINEQPATPSKTVTIANPADLEAVLSVIRDAKACSDVVVAAFHWGVHFTNDLAMYQPDVAYAAVDAGADVVIGTHPHCLQAVDVYNGSFIFYSLGNFAFEQPEPVAQTGVREYLSFYGLPNSSLPQNPHPEHCRRTALLKLEVGSRGVESARLLPVFFNDDAQPEPLKSGSPLHEEIAVLLETLSAEIGTGLSREGDELVVRPEKIKPVDTRQWVRTRMMSYPWLTQLVGQSTSNGRLGVRDGGVGGDVFLDHGAPIMPTRK
jgi:poly-gamma-glutamate synthesis protein (capsule biosynthesis protein)